MQPMLQTQKVRRRTAIRLYHDLCSVLLVILLESPEERLAQFPFARIKQMMKLDPEVGIVSAEAIFLVTKAAELFLQTLAKDTSFHTVASKKKTMSKRDVETAIDNVDSLVFLEGMMNV